MSLEENFYDLDIEPAPFFTRLESNARFAGLTSKDVSSPEAREKISLAASFLNQFIKLDYLYAKPKVFIADIGVNFGVAKKFTRTSLTDLDIKLISVPDWFDAIQREGVTLNKSERLDLLINKILFDKIMENMAKPTPETVMTFNGTFVRRPGESLDALFERAKTPTLLEHDPKDSLKSLAARGDAPKLLEHDS